MTNCILCSIIFRTLRGLYKCYAMIWFLTLGRHCRPLEKGALKKIVVRNGCEIAGLLSEMKYRCLECNRRLTGFCPYLSFWPSRGPRQCSGSDCRGTLAFCQTCLKGDLGNSMILRHVPESNVWKEITSFFFGFKGKSLPCSQ